MGWVDHAAVPVDDAALDDGGAHPGSNACDDAVDHRAAASADGRHHDDALVDHHRGAAHDDDDDDDDDNDRRPPRGGQLGPGPGDCWLGSGGGSHLGGSVVEDGLS